MVSRYSILFALLFTLTALASHYPAWLDLPPASIHQWRQADGAALSWNYAHEPDFWTPEVCNLFYASDAHAVGEFPMLYWLSGWISRNCDFPAYPLRWIGLLLLFAGSWAFGWMLLQFTKHPLLAALGAGLLLTAPLLIYYGPGFLPDAPAFCFILMMAACLVRADQKQASGWFVAAALCAALAILLKLSMAITPIALAISWLWGKRFGRWQTTPLWNGPLPLVLCTAVTGVVLGFRWWVSDYNALHNTAYFLTSTRPIWNYDLAFIWETIILAGKTGLPTFASAGLYLACLATLWLTVKQWKQTAFVIRLCLLCSLLGSIAYGLLWFRMFREHDYYSICLLVLPALLLLNGFRLAQPYLASKHLLWGLILCWLLGIWHDHQIMAKRLHFAFHPQTSENLPPDAFLRQNRLTEIGIPQDARVLCPQDPSPNIALLALQRQGWTAYNFGNRITADTLRKYQTKFDLTHLALRDTNVYSPLFRQFFPTKVGVVQGWYLYRQGVSSGK